MYLDAKPGQTSRNYTIALCVCVRGLVFFSKLSLTSSLILKKIVIAGIARESFLGYFTWDFQVLGACLKT